MKKIILTLLVFVLAYVSLGFACKKTQESSESKLRKALPIEIPSPLPLINQFETQKTALGATNLAITDSDKATASGQIDTGLDLLFESTKDLGYKNYNTHFPYTVVFATPTSFSQDGNCPTLNLKDGTKIAGTVIAIGNPSATLEPPFILVAANFNPSSFFCQDFTINAIRFEGEHIISWYNDKNIFYSHLGASDIHPFYPLPNGNLKQDNPQVINELNNLSQYHSLNIKDLSEKTVNEINVFLEKAKRKQ